MASARWYDSTSPCAEPRHRRKPPVAYEVGGWMPRKSRDRIVERSGSAVASWVLGGILLAVLVAIVFIIPEPTEFQRGVTRFFMALTAGCFAYFFVGGVVLKGTVGGQRIGATGGFVLFLLIQFVVEPFNLRTAVADAVPSLAPADPDIAMAQRTLAQRGLYSGPISGKANTQTREGIR